MHHFKVKYKFLSEEEGGRKTMPYQGYRGDFKYESSFIKSEDDFNKAYIIHPVFEDGKGNLFPENEPVPSEGVARMIIRSERMIDYHLNRIKSGMKCFIVEGSRIVANCEII